MLGTVFFFFVSLLVGKALLKFLRIQLPAQRVSELVAGIVTLTLLFFFLGFVFPFTVSLIGITLLIAGFISSFYIISMGTKNFLSFNVIFHRVRNIKVKEFILWILFILLVIWLFGRALFFNVKGQLVAGDRLVWIDWPVHMGIAANFAYGSNFPPQNPTFTGIPLIYPFFADFLSGVLLALGASIPVAYALPGIVLTVSFFALFVKLVEMTLPKSLKEFKLLKFMPLFLSLFWGGLGWIFWLKEVFVNQTTLVENLVNPPREYTFWGEKGLWFFTFLYSEILPQRSFLFGLPLFLLVILLIKSGWEKWNTIGKRHVILAGVIAGSMPFFHTHTFLSVWFITLTAFGLGVLWNWLQKSKQQRQFFSAAFLFFVPFTAVTLVQLPLFLGQHHDLPIEFGWLKGQENFFWFWFKNTGVFLPLMLLGLVKGRFSRFARLLGWSSLILFILPNLFRFAPWGYDNLKMFTYWYLLGSIFVAGALGLIWNQGKAGKVLAVVFFVSLTLSGVVEMSRIIDTKRVQIGLWSSLEQNIALEIRKLTPPDSVFLTAAIHDHPVATLAGRKIVIGFPGNSWSWGIDGWNEREKDVHTMLQGSPGTGELLRKYHIDYVYLSDRERYFDKSANQVYFASIGELVLQKGDVKIYKLNN